LTSEPKLQEYKEEAMKLPKNLFVLFLAVVLIFSVGQAIAQETNSGDPATSASEGLAPFEVKPAVTTRAVAVDLGPGSGAPPPTLGPYTMTPVPPGAPNCTGIAPPGPIPTPGGNISVAPWDYQACIGSGWLTWSHGYTGDAYPNINAVGSTQTITMPPDTGAFYFYVEPNLFQEYTCQATETGSGTSTGPFQVTGDSGARYVGFSATPGDMIQSVQVSCDTAANGFATGEYGWAAADESEAVGGTITGQLGLLAICKNNTTGQSVVAALGGGTAWDCEAAGLVVNTGDVVIQVPIGIVFP
jgi:hypothetical protein